MCKKRLCVIAALLFAALIFIGCARIDAMEAAAAPVPAATAAPTPAPTPASTPAATPTPSPVPTPFTIVWLSDTQLMAFQRPRALALMGEWIADNRIPRNIVQVVQTGDAVEHGANPVQWAAFDLCYNAFKDDIPFFAVSGNHEPGVREKDRSLFLSRPYVQSIPDERKILGGMAAYTTLHAGGEDFLILGAGWGAEMEALDWMDDVLTRYADHTAILLFHSFITPQGRVFDRYLALYDRLIVQHPNVRMVLCGHVLGRCHRIDAFDDDGDGVAERNVSIQLMNFQDQTDRSGQLRYFTFDTQKRTVAIATYSPLTDSYFRDGSHPEEIYTIENAF